MAIENHGITRLRVRHPDDGAPAGSLVPGTSVAASARNSVSLQVISIEALASSARIWALVAVVTDMGKDSPS